MEKHYTENRVKSRISWIMATAFAVIALFAAFMPFVFMIFNSFKGKFEMLTKGVFSPPEKRRVCPVFREQCVCPFHVVTVSLVYSGLCGLSASPFQVSYEWAHVCVNCGMYGDSDSHYVDSGFSDDEKPENL